MATAKKDILDGVSAQLLAEVDDLSDVAADVIFEELSSYTVVDRGPVRQSVGRNLRRAIETLQTNKVPSPQTGGEARDTTLERAEQGVPIEDIIRGYRISLHVIHDRFLKIAAAEGLEATDLLHNSNLLWGLGDWFTARAAVAYRSFALDEAVRVSVRKADWVNGLIGGGLQSGEAVTAARSLGLDPDLPMRVFYAVRPIRSDRSAIKREPTFGDASMTAHVDAHRHWVGITNQDSVTENDVVVALGPPVSLDRLPGSERVAGLIRAAMPRERPGIFRLEDLSWRIAVASEPMLTDYLRDRYLRPAEEHGEFGEQMVASIRAYLENDFSVVRAAKELVIHPNTQRYRMERYERLVGIDLRSIAVVVDLAFALQLSNETRSRFR